jgi:D-hydroxyproline dehydrogenase subunit gamma
MCPRITRSVRRPSPVTILVNGVAVAAYEGESLATALIASGTLVMSRDSSGRPRSSFCNMGICFDCLVTVQEPAPAGATVRRVRACLAEVRSGLLVSVAAQ